MGALASPERPIYVWERLSLFKMAIVRTTPRESGSGPDDGENTVVGKPVDRTKSVVNQGGRPLARPSRTPGMAARPGTTGPQQKGSRAFVQEVLNELRKVVWPTREARNNGTLITIGLLLFFSLYIFSLENGIRYLFENLNILNPASPR